MYLFGEIMDHPIDLLFNVVDKVFSVDGLEMRHILINY